MAVELLPDEIWRRIIEIGIETKTLNHKSLCCLSISSRRFNRISSDDTFWFSLLAFDFPSSLQLDTDKIKNCKKLFKIRYERDRERKRLEHRRAVLRIESAIAEHSRRIRDIEVQSHEESGKMNKAIIELSTLQKARRAAVALNVWQPEIVRGRQKQMVEQCNVSADYRVSALEMEIRLCRQQLAGFDKALRIEKRRLDAVKEQLASVKYHPLQEFSITSSLPVEHGKRKKKKHSSTI